MPRETRYAAGNYAVGPDGALESAMWNYAAILTLGLFLQAQPLSSPPSAKVQVDTRERELAERLSALERSVRVELEKPLEARKAKRGARVTAELMENLEFNEAVLVPRGAKIVGRVVDVRRTEGKSAITLSFDRAVMEGSQRSLVATIKAVGAPLQVYSAHWESSRIQSQNGARPELDALSIHGRLADNAQGVWGLPGLSLEEAGPAASVLRSKSADFKLESGTQMILRVTQR